MGAGLTPGGDPILFFVLQPGTSPVIGRTRGLSLLSTCRTRLLSPASFLLFTPSLPIKREKFTFVQFYFPKKWRRDDQRKQLAPRENWLSDS